MYCKKCGAECRDDAKFCPKCGSELKSGSLTKDDFHSSEDLKDTETSEEAGWFQKNRKTALIILIAAVVVVVIVIVAVSVSRHSSAKETMSSEEHMELGISYMEDDEYEEAVAEFTAVLDVEQNMLAYRYLADSYLNLGESDPTKDVQVEFNNKIYDGTSSEVYSDITADVYEEAVEYALDTYAQTDQLPEYTEEIYIYAADYEAKYGEVVRLNELEALIFGPEEEVENSGNIDETEVGSSNEANEALPTTEQGTVDWKSLYRDYVNNLPENDFLNDAYTEYDPTYSFSLIYIDDDEIPELLFQNIGEEGIRDQSKLYLSDTTYSYLLTIKNGEVIDYNFYRNAQGSFSYIEHSGLFCIYSGFVYVSPVSSKEEEQFYQNVYDMQGDKMYTTVFSGEYENVFQDDVEYKFLNNDEVVKVSEEEYMAELNAVYDTSQAVAPTMVSMDEIIEQLEE